MNLKLQNVISNGLAVGAMTVLGLAIGVGFAQSDSASEPVPPRPPWVAADGTVDLSKMPTSVGVLDSNGKPLLDKDGKEVRVNPRNLRPPLPAGPVQAGDSGIKGVAPLPGGVVGPVEVPAKGFGE